MIVQLLVCVLRILSDIDRSVGDDIPGNEPPPREGNTVWDGLRLGETSADPPEPEHPDLTCTPDPTKTVFYTAFEGPDSAGKSYGPATTLYKKHLKEDWNPWYPFLNGKDFEQAHWMVESGLTKTAIDSYLDRGLDGDLSESFQSADELWALLENLDFGFGDCGRFQVDLAVGPLYTRDLLQCIQLLFGHLPFADHIAFKPVQFHDTQNQRIYREM